MMLAADPLGVGQQYLDTGWFGVVVSVSLVVFVLFNIKRAHAKELYIRRIAGLTAIDEAVGRATEMGRPVVMVPGISNDGNINPKALQALKIFTHVARTAARFSTPILMCCSNAPQYSVATEMVRDVYQEEGLGDRFDPDSVRFISDRQFALAAGVSGLMMREKAAAAFFMGEFYAESLIFAETANTVGAIQVASSTEITQTPFFIAACDYVLIGDEFYAASAYLTRQPVLVGSLIGQDWCKIGMALLVLVGANVMGIQRQVWTNTEMRDGKKVELEEPRRLHENETAMYHLFHPQPDDKFVQSIKRTSPVVPDASHNGGGGS